jgi:hypothetical protein
MYTLIKKTDTGVYHLFTDILRLGELSVCKDMEVNDSWETPLVFITKDEARMKTAKIGDHVCGICIRELYGKF